MNVLLHVCCGVCASSCIESLLCAGHTVTCFFYNPNIHPQDEYKRRLGAAEKAASEWKVEIIEGMYDRERWFELIKGTEYESEGGARCQKCIRMRLEKTYEFMKKRNFDAFTTTLSVSPHKDSRFICDLGEEIGGDKFLCENFKKNGGFKRAQELSREWGLYHQDYCGCIYSLEEAERRKIKNEKKNQKSS